MWISSRRLLEKLAVLGAIVLGAASALAMLAHVGWFPELFSHFRLQYALGSLLLVLIFLLLRRRKLALLVAVALAAPNLWYVAPYLLPVLVPASVAESKGQDVAVISINLYYRNNHYPAVRDYLRSSKADVLVLSELTPEWAAELRPVTADYPYWMSLNRRTPWGLGVFSRYPLLNARATDLGVPRQRQCRGDSRAARRRCAARRRTPGVSLQSGPRRQCATASWQNSPRCSARRR